MMIRSRTGSQKIVHHTNIQILLLEIYKIKYNLCGSCLKNLFSDTDGNYNLHSASDFGVPGINNFATLPI